MSQKGIELSRATSSIQMMNALVMSVSIIMAAGILYLINGNDYVSFFVIGSILSGLVAEVSIIRYTLAYREKLLGGSLSFGRSVSFGIRIYFLSGLLLTFAAYLFFRFNPGFFFDLLNQLKDLSQLAQNEQELEELNKQIALLESQFSGMTPISLAFNLYVSYFTAGFFATILHSLFTNKSVTRRSETDDDENINS